MWDQLMHIEWAEMFWPTHSLAEMVVRGTIMYVGLFIILRLVLKRQSGGSSVTDILVIVLIADAAQNGMAKEYKSVTEGLTIIGWNYLLNFLTFYFPLLEHLIQEKPLLLVKNGQLQRRNMRQELLTPGELMSELRQYEIESLNDVESAYMEPDGRISIVPVQKNKE
jgi:uncharacterized membrane protein YcaP (DUF421 family)